MKQLYDKVGQVTDRDFLFSGSPADESYTWDAAGNPTDFDGDDYDVNLLNEIDPAGGGNDFTYDTDGNLTADTLWTYEYDGENRLIEMVAKSGNPAAAKRLEFEYDYLHRRIEKRTYDATSGGNLTLHRIFVYDLYNCIAEFDENLDIQMSYFWGLDRKSTLNEAGGAEALLLVTAWSGNYPYWPIYDLNSNVVGMLGASADVEAAYTYDSFGEASKEGDSSVDFSDGNPYRFATQYTDDDGAQTRADGEIEDLARRVEEPGALRAATKQTGLVYYGHRFYNPAIGRFLNRDPIGENGGGANLYRYTNNDAINSWDVLGLAWEYRKVGERLDYCTEVAYTDGSGNYVVEASCHYEDIHDWVWISESGGSGASSGVPFPPSVEVIPGVPEVTFVLPQKEEKKPCPPSQTGPINYRGGITYRRGALLYSHGRFSGVVVSNTNPAQIVEVSGHLDGMGFQVGFISGQAPVSFSADSVEDLGNSTQGGIFRLEAGFGAGPATAAGGNGMLGTFPDREGGHNVTSDYGFDFLEVDPVLAVWDLLEKPKFGFGIGVSFTGITVTDAEVIGEIGTKDEDCE